MYTNLAKTLLTASSLAIGLSNLAYAGLGGDRSHFTTTSAQADMSACKGGKFDPYQDGLRIGKPDPYSDGARMDQRDPYTDGARMGERDPYTDGARLGAAGGGCLLRNA